MDENHNAMQLPRMFYCRHMQPGTCKYENEMVLVDTDALKKMIPTGVGKPVYVHHQKVDLNKLKEKADGYITESFYNELDGWAWFKIIIVGDEAHNAADNKWAVSNAYKPTIRGGSGTKNNVPFDSEILDGIFTHLAIVPNPRYESALIMTPEEFRRYQELKKLELAELQNSNNSKGSKPMSVFKLFRTKKEEVTTVDLDTEVEFENGKSISVRDMLTAVKEDEKRKELELRNKKNDDAGDEMIECEGEKIPMKELVSAYKNMKKNEKKNETPEDKKAREEKENADKEMLEKAEKDKLEKENARIASEKKQTDEELQNAKFYDDLKNANANYSSAERPKISAPQNGFIRGKNRYGSVVKK